MTFEEFIGDRVNVLSPQEYHAVEAAWKHQQNHNERLEWYLTDAKNALKERRQIIERQRITIADLTEKLDIERNRIEELEQQVEWHKRKAEGWRSIAVLEESRK